jgi:hypothetical protein
MADKKSMYVRIHQTPQGRIVAACDRELLGSILDDGRTHLDLKAYREFYSGELVNEAGLEDALRDFSSANLVGKRAVGVALGMKLAREKDVIYINKTPHIQLYNI